MPNKSTPTLAVCEQCGNQFRTYPSRVKIGAARFCSVACRNDSMRGKKGADAAHYKGAKTLFNGGHVIITRPDGGGVVQEHRYVMEQHLGRPLRRDEIVHHKDFDPANNAIENLQIMTNAEHSRLHALMRREAKNRFG